jgi:hypothetical protein
VYGLKARGTDIYRLQTLENKINKITTADNSKKEN